MTTQNMPVLALRGLTAFPGQTLSFDAEREISILALENAMEGDREKKEALADAIREDTHRLEGEIAQLKIKQEENDAESGRMNALMLRTT